MECLIRELWDSVLWGWNCVRCIIIWIWNYGGIIHYDALVGNLIAVVHVAIVWWGLQYTYSKVKSELRKRKSDITTGFYTHLLVFIRRLGTLTGSREQPLYSFWSLSSSEPIRAKENKALGDLLKNLSHEFLCYLSTSPQQVPPDDEDRWRKNMSALIDYLIRFELIHTETTFPSLSSEDAMTSYHRTLVNILESMKKAIDAEILKSRS
jgi:hypothetical protein